ncbi:MAG: TIM barrel protein [Planctomycetota bacterium]
MQDRACRFSVCVDAVFEGVPEVEAIRRVKQSGLDAIEFWRWWDKDLAAIRDCCSQHDVSIAAICTKFISLVDADKRNDYVTGVIDSAKAAAQLNCSTLISQVGDYLPGVDRQTQRESLVAGLVEVAPILEEAGITLVIEPLNDRIDHPGYFLVNSDEAFEIVEQVDSPRVKVLFDIYHQQISEGHIIERLIGHCEQIGHLHAAGNPGRHELTRGELAYPEIFRSLSQTNYEGFIGLEYWPVDDPISGLRTWADFK